MRKDLPHEGKEKVELDIDRIVNEGLAGGTVIVNRHHRNIEEALPQPKQEKQQ